MPVEVADVPITAIQQGVAPPYAYTNGLEETLGYELICAGALRFNVWEIDVILRSCAKRMAESGWNRGVPVGIDGVGTFSIGEVHQDWLTSLVPAQVRRQRTQWIQVVPSGSLRTIDTPTSPSRGPRM